MNRAGSSPAVRTLATLAIKPAHNQNKNMHKKINRRSWLTGSLTGSLCALSVATTSQTLKTSVALAASATSATPFRLACGWPGSGTWTRGQNLTRQLFTLKRASANGRHNPRTNATEQSAKLADLEQLSFRAISANGDLGARALLDRGDAEAALIERLPPRQDTSTISNARRMGIVGFSALHCLIHPSIRLDSNPSQPFTNLRIALIGFDREREANQIESLGATIRGPFTQTHALEVFAAKEADGLAFWDALPSPIAQNLLTRARLVALTLRNEPTRFLPSDIYPGASGLQSSVRALEWVLSARSAPWQDAVRHAAKQILTTEETEGSLWL
ncbi:MAG: hypothetical protein OD811_06180 [Alphaproteobacteria bacterium]